jgi:pimeloyl-ACP methyl ester carboxylesterase
MEHASTTALPAYPPIGINDLHVALTQIDAGMEAAYPGRLGARAIMGSSMGAFQSLFMAATEAENTNALIHFERYVAIDSPVNLRYAVTNLDRYYQAPMAWPEAEREANIRNTLLKVAALVTQPGNGNAQLPFNTIESEFLIGFAFHFTLRDIIFSSQLRHNLGVLQQPVVKSRREAVYNEILKYSFRNYIDDFAMPYDRALGIDLNDPKVIEFGTSLKAHTAELAANPNVRVILNRNDLLLNTDDLAWMEATFPVARVTEFPDGGHVGNLWQPAVQRAIVQALDGLGAEPSGR